MKTPIIFAILTLLLSGCRETYRYPCQDPENWEREECQRPRCEVDGQCRDDLTGGVSEKIIDKDIDANTPAEQQELVE